MRRWFALVLVLTVGACRRESAVPPAPAAPVTAFEREREREPAPAPPVAPRLTIVPVDAEGSASAGPIALARYGGRTLAFVADADDHAVVTVDVGARTTLASTPLSASPSALLVTPDSRVVVLGADDARLHLMVVVGLDAPLVEERMIGVPEEPVSAALVPGRDALLVVSRWGHALSFVPLASGEAPVVIELTRDPSAVVASADGRWALVTHAAGSRASVVNLVSREVRTTSLDRKVERPLFITMMPMAPQMTDITLDLDAPVPLGSAPPAQSPRPRKATAPPVEMVTLHADQSFAAVRSPDGRLFAPETFVDTGPPAPSGGYGGSIEATATPAVASFDASTGALEAPGGDRTFGTRCLLPRGAALEAEGRTLLVACLGSDSLVVLGVTAKGLRLRRIVDLPKGPVGVAADATEHRAVVWSAFDRALSVVSLTGVPKLTGKAVVPRAAAPPAEEVLRGRAVFHATFESRVSSDGRACASCHPDGRDDGLTWSSPNGPMQTPMLFARLAETAPYGWDGAAKDLTQHLAHTTSRLGGTGLSKRDVTDIGAYLASLRSPDGSVRPDRQLVARGSEVFHSAEAQCSSCHAGEASTDGESHDVKSGPSGRKPQAFDTPSLRFVSRSAPYFHDGRYASLGEMLAGSDGAMGHTSQLSVEDRAALEVYLRTL
ncbi:MAG: cytochrome C peroxidase [Polyangiaceae bacterium]